MLRLIIPECFGHILQSAISSQPNSAAAVHIVGVSER